MFIVICEESMNMELLGIKRIGAIRRKMLFMTLSI